MTGNIFDRTGALARLEGDEELYRMVLDTYLEDIPLQIVKLRETVPSGDAQELRRLAHSIKGASANIGALAVRDLSLEIELCAGKSGIASKVGEAIDRLESAFKDFMRTARSVYP